MKREIPPDYKSMREKVRQAQLESQKALQKVILNFEFKFQMKQVQQTSKQQKDSQKLSKLRKIWNDELGMLKQEEQHVGKEIANELELLKPYLGETFSELYVDIWKTMSFQELKKEEEKMVMELKEYEGVTDWKQEKEAKEVIMVYFEVHSR